jgi:hypothetical protein
VTTFADIRTTLAQIVETILPCEPYLSAQINPPCAQIARRASDPNLVFTEATQVNRFGIRIYVAAAVEDENQALLDEYLDRAGALSVSAAVEADDNWPTSLEVHHCILLERGEPGWVEVAGATYIVADLEVEVCW